MNELPDPNVILYYQKHISDFLRKFNIYLNLSLHRWAVILSANLCLEGIAFKAFHSKWSHMIGIEITVMLITISINLCYPFKDNKPDDLWGPVIVDNDENEKSPE